MSFRFVSDHSGVSTGWYARWASDGYVLGITDKTFNLQSFNIYPNPVRTELYVEFSALRNESLNIELFDINGKVLKKNIQQIKSGKNKLNLSTLISGLKPGSYFLNISSNHFNIIKKIILQ